MAIVQTLEMIINFIWLPVWIIYTIVIGITEIVIEKIRKNKQKQLAFEFVDRIITIKKQDELSTFKREVLISNETDLFLINYFYLDTYEGLPIKIRHLAMGFVYLMLGISNILWAIFLFHLLQKFAFIYIHSTLLYSLIIVLLFIVEIIATINIFSNSYNHLYHMFNNDLSYQEKMDKIIDLLYSIFPYYIDHRENEIKRFISNILMHYTCNNDNIIAKKDFKNRKIYEIFENIVATNTFIYTQYMEGKTLTQLFMTGKTDSKEK